MPVHNHPPYRPNCSERRLDDGSLVGACLRDEQGHPYEATLLDLINDNWNGGSR